MYKWAKGHLVPLYLSKVGTLTWVAVLDPRPNSSYRRPPNRTHQILPWPLGILQWAQAFVEPHCFQIVLTIPSLSSLVLSDRRGSIPLRVCPGVLPHFVCLCRGRCVTIWESFHLRHRLCLRVWRSESLWISGIFPSLFWLSGTTLLTCRLHLISYQCPQHLHHFSHLPLLVLSCLF